MISFDAKLAAFRKDEDNPDRISLALNGEAKTVQKWRYAPKSVSYQKVN